MSEAALIYTTWPDAETAQAAARAAVDAGLAACANVFPPHQAVYRWNGGVETGVEVAVIFKTAAASGPRLRDWIVARHPYELPAVVALDAGQASSAAYLAWVVGASEPPSTAARDER